MEPSLPVTGDPEANRLLVEDPLARLIGMMLDQRSAYPREGRI